MKQKFNFDSFNESEKGTPLVFLHGWGGSKQSLNPLAQSVSDETKSPIYNLELPGFGETPMISDDQNIEDVGNFVIEFLKSQKISKVILAGHSFGGKLSLHLATSANKDFIARLILINASGLKPNNTLKKTFAKTLKNILPESVKNLGKPKEFFYKYILRERDYLNAAKLKPMLAKVVEQHYDEKLKEINSPTLIIWGENDSYVPLWMGRKMSEEIKNSKLIIVPEGKHGLPLTKPDLVAQIISNWV